MVTLAKLSNILPGKEIRLHASFVRQSELQNAYQNEVDRCAKAVLEFLNDKRTRTKIQEVHHVGASSQMIQEIMRSEIEKLGFVSEKKGLFSGYQVQGIRPDFYKPLGHGGILFEVERGKTLANNMDLLDIWKTHLCREASHLFLLVPEIRITHKGTQQKIFTSVVNRVGTFFTSSVSPLDVDSVNIFGY